MDVREKLVEILKQAPFEGKVLDEWWWEEKIRIIADHLISNGVTVQEWISVKDRLPDVGKFVLIYNEINGVLLDYHDGATFGYYDVTHWMPLPQPPKGE